MTDDKEMIGTERMCKRCEDWTRNFIPDYQVCCRKCLTPEELHNYIVSPLTKAMRGITSKEKKAVLVNMIEEFKEKKRHENVIQEIYKRREDGTYPILPKLI